MISPGKKYLFLLLLLLAGPAGLAQTSLMTYNIRYNTPNDGENWWEKRKQDVAKLIGEYKPDIFGLQEGLHGQVEYLKDNLVDYSYVGVGRDDGRQKGEYTALFYNRRTYKLIHTYTYWLSETPEQVSVGWDAAMERITTMAGLVNLATGDTLYVFNAHYDHRGRQARENSSKLILQLIDEQKLADKALVVMGDLNARPEEAPIRVLTDFMADAYTQTKPNGPVGTFNAFDPKQALTARIDYILTKNLQVRVYRAIDDKRPNGLYPSDHLPVFVEVEF